MNTLDFNSKKLFALLFMVSIAAFFHACVKEEDFGKTTITLPDAKEMITTNIFGLVVDENELPVVNSEVLLQTERGFEKTTTDENGNFKYFDVSVVREGAFLKVHQSGKFEGFRKMNVTPKSYNYTKIKLLDKTIAGSVSSTSGGTVTHSSSATLKLPANGVRYETGGDYTGSVNVAMSWIDPTAEDLPARMVGDLSGVDENGEEVVLGTYGMLNVELLADNGDELQLKDGSPATLSFPVPSEIRNQAPATIPLWSYNEDIGTWFEEGSASLQGGFYVGDVTHFSSWNCDYKGERITVTGNVVSQNGSLEEIATPFLQIFITVEDILNKGGYLSSDGEFEFYNFPANEEFTITIKDRCDNILYEEQFGPYADDTDLGTITVPTTADNFVNITGSGTDCSDNTVIDGYINFELDNMTFLYPINSDGTFEFVVNVCDETSGDINLIDVINEKVSPVQAVDLTSGAVNLGILKACDELASFVDVKIDGVNALLFLDASANFSLLGSPDYHMTITSDKMGPTDINEYYFNLTVLGVSSVGTYNDVTGYWANQSQETGFFQLQSNTTVEITQYGDNPGDIIRGTFMGDAVTDSIGIATTIVPVSGSFKAIRE